MPDVLVFSPTGNSRKVALHVAANLGGETRVLDLCNANQVPQSLQGTAPVIVAGPVFGGRVPTLMIQRLRQYSLKGAKVITIVTYGNRAYEDALIELNDLVSELGGTPVASAAVVARHSMVPSVASDRPNDIDFHNLECFTNAVKNKLKDPGNIDAVSVPGNRPYRQWQKAPLTPVIVGTCIHCGLCAKTCPTQAIDPLEPSCVDSSKCILCMRCVMNCATKARVLPQAVQTMINEKLAPIANIHRNSEFFL